MNRKFTDQQANEMYIQLKNILLAWSYIEDAGRTENAVLLATNTEDEIKAVMDVPKGSFSIMHVDVMFRSARKAIDGIDTELFAKDGNPQTVSHVVTLIGKEEAELLALLVMSKQKLKDLEKAGYSRALLRLTACEFIREVLHNHFTEIYITQAGRDWLRENTHETP